MTCLKCGPEGLLPTSERIADTLGPEFVKGGVHPSFGTCNVSFPLCHGQFLEVVQVLEHPASLKAPPGQAVRGRRRVLKSPMRESECMLPAADVHLDLPLVRSLLARQAPQWSGLPLRPAASGWDNVMVRLGEELAVRLPRRAAAAPLLSSEAEWAPVLAPQLPLPIPVPRFLGAPQGEYPYPWLVTAWLTGEPAARFPARARDGYAGQLAGFLAAFHTVPDAAGPRRAGPLAARDSGVGGVVGAASGASLPHNPVRGVPVAERVDVWRDRLREAVTVDGPLGGSTARVQRLAAALDAALGAPRSPGPPVWVHGDPHPLNTLVGDVAADAGQRAPARPAVGLDMTGVVDLGDLTIGDPASDLGAAWLHFTPNGLATFRAEYGRARPESRDDAGLWDRAAGWAVNYVLTLLGDTSELGDCARTALAAHWPV